MPINIIHDYPRNVRIRRFFGLVASILGILLILAGLIAAIPLIIFLISIIVSIVMYSSMPDFTQGDQLYIVIAVSIIISVICLSLGHRLVRGKRRLVLFLRRFGFIEATQALTFALATAIGKSWRVVTLDDARVTPMGVKRGMRWVSAGVGVIAILIVAALLFWLFGGAFENWLESIIENNTAPQSDLNQAISEMLGNAILRMFTVVVIGGMVILIAAFLVSISIFSWRVNTSVRRAERSKAVEISEEGKIEPTAKSVLRRGRWIFSPRLTVVRVASAFWQETVRRIAAHSSTVVIDISEPTESLLWEVENLKPKFGSRWVLVGEQDHLNNMVTAVPGQNSPVNQRLFDILDGENVLAYTSKRSDRKRFATCLRAKLEGM